MCSGTIPAGSTCLQSPDQKFFHTACIPDDDDADDDDAPGAVNALSKKLLASDGETETSDLERRILANVIAEMKRRASESDATMQRKIDTLMKATFDGQLPSLVEAIRRNVNETCVEVVKGGLADARQQMRDEMSRQLARIANEGAVKQEYKVTGYDGVTRTLEGEVFHPRFSWMLRLADARIPIFMAGPTGCGKTHIGQQIARALGLRFGMISCSPGMTESKIAGRSIPNIATGQDVYRCSEFVNIFENGGVFMLDEIDAADPSVLLTINSALANRMMPVPDRPDKPYAKAHDNFIAIAAANTFGTGADRQYVGRFRLDEATLDRFRMGFVAIDYSPMIERHLCPDVSLYETLTMWRSRIMERKWERILSTRFMRDAYTMITRGATILEVAHAFFAGWPEAHVTQVYGGPLPELT